MYFIYVFYLKLPPPYHIPPTVYLLQPGLTHVVHGKLPGFVPTPGMYMYKNKNEKVQMLHKIKIKTVQLVPVNILRHYPSPLQRRSYLCSFLCRYRESMLYLLNAQKEHTRAFFVWTAQIWESIPILEHVGVISQFPHLYIFVLPPTLMWMGFSMNSLILGRSAEVVAVASTSISSCLVSNLVGIGVGMGVVAILMYLSSCGSSPAPTSLHVSSNATHPSATN